MVKKIIGVVATLAILALIVFTVLGAGSYESMLPERWFASDRQTASAVVEQCVEAPVVVEEVDSVATDSVVVESVDMPSAIATE